MERKKTILLISIIFLASFSGILIINYHLNKSDGPIRIRGNDELEAMLHETGSGNATNPYILEDYKIFPENKQQYMNYGIALINIDAYLIIRNCYIENAQDAIFMNDCSNIQIINCYFKNNGKGINLYDSNHNISVSRNNFEDNIWGIRSWNSQNTTYSNNILNNNTSDAFLFYNSSDFTLSGNQMTSTGIHFWDSGDFINPQSINIDSTNLINGKPILYLNDKTNIDGNYFSNASQVILINCSYTNITNLHFSDGSNAITLLYCNNIYIEDIFCTKFK